MDASATTIRPDPIAAYQAVPRRLRIAVAAVVPASKNARFLNRLWRTNLAMTMTASRITATEKAT